MKFLAGVVGLAMSSCLWLPFILIDANFLGNAGLFAFASLIGLLMLMQCIDEGLELRSRAAKQKKALWNAWLSGPAAAGAKAHRAADRVRDTAHL